MSIYIKVYVFFGGILTPSLKKKQYLIISWWSVLLEDKTRVHSKNPLWLVALKYVSIK